MAKKDFERMKPTGDPRSKNRTDTETLDVFDPYPFLRASLGDYSLAIELSSEPDRARQAVCLMHDAIEFALYEILIHMNWDIYRDGQHTIGLDGALTACRNLNVSVPLLGTVRAIQKQRGDAKHHAQRPDAKTFNKILREFRIVISSLVHERFGETLGEALRTLDLTRYHQGLYDCYRKYRNQNWSLALRNSLGALVYKQREMLNLQNEYTTALSNDPFAFVAILERDIANASYPVAKDEILVLVRGLPETLRDFLNKGDEKGAAECAGKAYLQIDGILPSSFNILDARKFTPKLLQPRTGTFGDMSWSSREPGDTPETIRYLDKIQEFLAHHSEIVKSFGAPFYMDDDDRYWKWWEFAIFDGEKWSVFHVDDRFRAALEWEHLAEGGPPCREQTAKAIYEEFASLEGKLSELPLPESKGIIHI